MTGPARKFAQRPPRGASGTCVPGAESGARGRCSARRRGTARSARRPKAPQRGSPPTQTPDQPHALRSSTQVGERSLVFSRPRCSSRSGPAPRRGNRTSGRGSPLPDDVRASTHAGENGDPADGRENGGGRRGSTRRPDRGGASESASRAGSKPGGSGASSTAAKPASLTRASETSASVANASRNVQN